MPNKIDDNIDPSLFIQPPPPIIQTQTTATPTSPEVMGISTTSASNGEAVKIVFNASLPNLQQTIADTEQKIVSNMLDGWLKSIEDQKQRALQEFRSPEHQRMVEVHSSSYIANQEANSSKAVGLAMETPGINNYAQLSNLQGVIGDFIKAGGIGSAAGVLSIMSAGSEGNLLSSPVNPAGSMFQEMWQSSGVGYKDNYSAQLGLIGGLFSSGLNVFSSTETAVKAKTKDNVSPKAFAADYAKNMVAFVKNPDFDRFIRAAVLSKMPGSDNYTQARKDQLVAIVKITMLSASAALMYKAETNWKVGPTEFKDLIAGKINLPENDPRHAVIAEINNQLTVLNDQREAERLINGLARFFNSNPSDAEMTQPSSVFAGLFDGVVSNRLDAKA